MPTSRVTRSHVWFPAEGVDLQGDLSLPQEPRGLILFAHGSGSSRRSPRNRFVAQQLQVHMLGTFLFDLLTQQEEEIDRDTAHIRFDIQLLARRLIAATDWILQHPSLSHLPIGYFGASTGAAAALVAASQRPDVVPAVVSRGGRPDLAGNALAKVKAATLLIVGGFDDVVIELNERALKELGTEHKQLTIVPEASHLFVEPGKLEVVAQLAGDWFAKYLASPFESATHSASKS